MGTHTRPPQCVNAGDVASVKSFAARVGQLKDMTGDLKEQVVDDGKTMDATSAKIIDTEANVEVATVDLSKSADYAASIRKKQCCIAMIVLAVVTAVVVVIVVMAQK